MPADGPSGSDSVTEKLKALSGEFLGVLPERMAAVEQTNQALTGPIWDAPDIDSHYRSVHNLAGSSGTFGFVELSAAARTVLEILEPLMGAKFEVTAKVRDEFEKAMADFRSAAENPIADDAWLNPPG